MQMTKAVEREVKRMERLANLRDAFYVADAPGSVEVTEYIRHSNAQLAADEMRNRDREVRS